MACLGQQADLLGQEVDRLQSGSWTTTATTAPSRCSASRAGAVSSGSSESTRTHAPASDAIDWQRLGALEVPAQLPARQIAQRLLEAAEGPRFRPS
jgi:hypothetical protein